MSDMLVALYRLPEQNSGLEKLKANSIDIRRAIAPEKQQVLDWVRSHFSQPWVDECDVAFARQPVTCYIALEHGKMIGFACYEATCRNFFGPTGVSPSARGKGVGTALLLACMHAMRADGYGYSIIGSAGPVDFYKRTLGAVEIENSTPGIYEGMLRAE
ncbi:GNAT family N-acetyltransferase [Paenibacillus silvae]|uniref:GNAT family N-acetyltransferase n=1 Tax=Paenibacillus silvae TaxID=1325358 RepID=UPI0025A22818|nr:GNAT family N-acetyltransferase [Paenibacillus silvae]MDM5280098.1 GNAT family N-acetyltransferase [Paenibacillus silvae]